MRILICASDVPLPPTTTGYRRQLMGLVPELGKRNEVRLIGYRMPDQRTNPAAEAQWRIIPYAKPKLAGSLSDLALATALQRPARAERLVRGLRQALREELERFGPDVVHVGPGKLAGLLPELGGRPCVLNLMDTWHLNVEARALTTTSVKAPLFRADAKRIMKFEAVRYRGWDRVVVSNSGDLKTLRALDPTLPFEIIPIGFDAGAYAPDETAAVDPDRIIFHGAMGYAPNVVAVEYLALQVLPLVRAVRPATHLVLAGRDPSPRVLALGELDGVTVTGEVEDMRAELVRSRVWVGPFQSGTGIKTKLLEAMAADVPCVVTPLGARGVDAVAGKELLIGDHAEQLADHVLRVLADDDLARRLGHAGGEFVRPRYDWPAVASAYEGLYRAAIDKKAAVRS
ncbi:MAG: glycosyltransferase family 4 protein [Egibacteraceae bacterium]